ncbi:MAG: hypothetical protein ACOVLE_02375 [Pirellula staleyi]
MTLDKDELRRFVIPRRIRDSFPLLLEGIDYAMQTGSDVWDFAVEIRSLTALGLVPNDFRWLVRSGLIVQRREVTREGDHGRAFQAVGDITFSEKSCFVLTNKGIFVARDKMGLGSPNACSAFASDDRHLNCDQSKSGMVDIAIAKPNWDSQRRVLLLNGIVVKYFKWAAENQEAILFALEEEGWPQRIDDPLRPTHGQDPKRRLSDTIKCLNRKQENSILHFRGDGTGEGVVWERCNGLAIETMYT